jgi:hypothetical protein
MNKRPFAKQKDRMLPGFRPTVMIGPVATRAGVASMVWLISS